jgi:hypothetical protein
VIPILTERILKKYTIGMVVFALIFIMADQPKFDENTCQKNALHLIANSTESKVLLDEPCPVLSWEISDNPVKSGYNAQLLQRWMIVGNYKEWYHASELLEDD